MNNIDVLINRAPPALHDAVEDALRAFAEKLFVVEETFKELGTDARIVWLTAETTRIDTAKSLRSTLQHVRSVASWIDNWSECAKQGTPETDDGWNVLYDVQAAADGAVKALHALVDHVRQNTPRVKAAA